MRGIDWAASARLSAARSEDAFIVRERFADESPRVVVVADRRPAMALCPSDLPWLDKAATMRNAGLLIATSTARSRGAIGSLDFGDGDVEPVWLSPKPSGQWRVEERAATGAFAWVQWNSKSGDLFSPRDEYFIGISPPSGHALLVIDITTRAGGAAPRPAAAGAWPAAGA